MGGLGRGGVCGLGLGWVYGVGGKGNQCVSERLSLSRNPRPPQTAQAGARLKPFTESTLFMKNVALAENLFLENMFRHKCRKWTPRVALILRHC